MSTSAAYKIQTAIYAALSGDATFTGYAAGGIFWDVPDNTATFPYYAMGETTDVPSDTMGTICHDVTVTHHAYDHRDSSESPTRLNNVVSRAIALLDRATLSVSGGTVYSIRREFDQIMRDEPMIWHYVVRFRVKFQES